MCSSITLFQLLIANWKELSLLLLAAFIFINREWVKDTFFLPTQKPFDQPYDR